MAAKLTNEFSWSQSRHNTFRDCLRKYYYQYYGSWGGWDRNAAPRARDLYILKKLQSRWMWVGDHVHRSVQAVLTDVRAGRTPWMPEAAADAMLARMRTDFRASLDGRYRQDPVRACGLFEHEYEVQLSGDAWKQVADHAVSCLRMFFESEVFGRMRALPGEAWLEIEERASFLLSGLKVFVQLDAAWREGDDVLIYDWKTGRSNLATSDIQTGCYLLYARERWKATPERTKAVAFNLSTGEQRERSLTDDDLDDVSNYILDSADEMLVPLEDSEKNIAREDAFDFTDDETVCRRCNFLRACLRWK